MEAIFFFTLGNPFYVLYYFIIFVINFIINLRVAGEECKLIIIWDKDQSLNLFNWGKDYLIWVGRNYRTGACPVAPSDGTGVESVAISLRRRLFRWDLTTFIFFFTCQRLHSIQMPFVKSVDAAPFFHGIISIKSNQPGFSMVTFISTFPQPPLSSPTSTHWMMFDRS